MMQLQQDQRAGLLMVASAAVLWGTIGVVIQAIYQIDDPSSLFINWMRLLIAAPLLLMLCARRVGWAMLRIRRRDLGIMMLSGALLATSHAAYFAAIRASGVTIATLLTICVAPIVVTLLSTALRLERLTRRKLLALGSALLGSALLVGIRGATPGDDALIGALYALAAALTYGGMMVCGRFLASGGYHSLQTTSVMFITGAVGLMLVNLSIDTTPVQSPTAWGLVVYLGIVPTALAYWLFHRGLRTINASSASIISMIDPFVAALLAWAIYAEMLSPLGVVGAGLLLGSLWLVASSERG